MGDSSPKDRSSNRVKRASEFPRFEAVKDRSKTNSKDSSLRDADSFQNNRGDEKRERNREDDIRNNEDSKDSSPKDRSSNRVKRASEDRSKTNSKDSYLRVADSSQNNREDEKREKNRQDEIRNDEDSKDSSPKDRSSNR